MTIRSISDRMEKTQRGEGYDIMEKPPVYEGSEPYIFVSYAHAISNQAMKIINWLYEAGYRIWYDEGLECGGAV